MKLEKLNMEIGERLRGLRKKKGLSQTAFCKKMQLQGINISKNKCSRYETGTTAIPIDYVIAFCNYFNVTTDYLIKGEEISVDKRITRFLNLSNQNDRKAINRFANAIAQCTNED